MRLYLTIVVALSLCFAAQGGVTGAIFTTIADGTVVNANHFDSKCAVYLDGGPGPHAPAHAAGLPDGAYYFQVTDPSGRQLLSTDVVSNRSFQVANGVIVAYTGSGGAVHPTGLDQDHPELGAITIRLANASCPTDYLDTPNNGGTYKVWATPVTDFVGDPSQVDNACGSGCFHGFVASKSKTDNFKAKAGTPTFCLTVQKELQQEDGSSLPGPSWPIDVTDPLMVTNHYFTDGAGQMQMCGLAEGSYRVDEVLLYESIVMDVIVNGASTGSWEPSYSFTWTLGAPMPVIVFRNAAGGSPE